ncbi:hypothetical protein B0J13DRAFT_62519 [Dactylonectria estremocensis]|uniref:Uncharacterized protein n=1 Tax=Dactylonectria estremocensis TaxID=1079267 RepID=A0A9P9IY92_9HYPO|nr:hypothetical protein B0J13DRAFT_62519 [Dactylonectria estremocensis]
MTFISPCNQSPLETQRLAFLTLPAEIRLNIYSWVHAGHPIEHAQLDPGYPIPPRTIYFTKPVRAKLLSQLNSSQHSSNGNVLCNMSVGPEQETQRLLRHDRPLSRIPTSLLVVNRQVYLEARSLPFLKNEFAFVNWFSSGLSLANSLVPILAPWQQALLRFARLESFTTDFQENEHNKWNNFCGLLSPGLRGLRIRIQGENTPPVSLGPRSKTKFAMPESSWRCLGLAVAEMKALRWLEIELNIAAWSGTQKIAWCKKLEESVNMAKKKGKRDIRVVCVEWQASC